MWYTSHGQLRVDGEGGKRWKESSQGTTISNATTMNKLSAIIRGSLLSS